MACLFDDNDDDNDMQEKQRKSFGGVADVSDSVKAEDVAARVSVQKGGQGRRQCVSGSCQKWTTLGHVTRLGLA